MSSESRVGVVYGRTSKETDDAYSVSSQIDAGQLYASRNGIKVPAEYVFREDYTGRALDRPAYSKIRELIRQRRIQVVILYATDRLARKVSVGEILLDEMFEYGVELHIVAWNTNVRDLPEDRLRFNFETTFSGFERDKIAERTLRGRIKKASQGNIIGNYRTPYGYSMNEYMNNFVLSEYAPIARKVLVDYGVHQKKAITIAGELEAAGHKTPGTIFYEYLTASYRRKYEAGRLSEVQLQARIRYAEQQRGNGRWTPGNIYSILHNFKTYSGTCVFSIKGHTFEVEVPPIISKEEAAQVEHMLSVGRRKFARKATTETRFPFLMARRLTCTCGFSYRALDNQKGWQYYMCGSKRPRVAERCDSPNPPRSAVDDVVRGFVKDLLLDPQRLFGWWQIQHEAQAADTQKIEEQAAGIEARIEATQAKLHRTLDRLTDVLDEDELAFYGHQRESLKALLAEYREERERLQKLLSMPRVSAEVIEDYAQIGQRYKETLETSDDFYFWRGLVDDLDVTGVLGVDEQGRRYIDLVVFGKPRKREFLDRTDDGGGQQKGSDGSISEKAGTGSASRILRQPAHARRGDRRARTDAPRAARPEAGARPREA